MSQKVISLLADAFEDPNLQQKLHAANTPESFVKIAAENGYKLTKEELATSLGKVHVVFGEVVQSMLSELVGEAPTTNGKIPTIEKNSGTNKEGVIMSEQLQAVVQLSGFVLDEDWEQVKTFLTEDIFYKVGSAEPVYGKQAVVGFLSSMFENTAKFTGHNIRKIWNEPGIIVVEMDAKYTTVEDKRHLTIACCDIYRLRGNQVSEWRVYADILPFYQTDPDEQQTKKIGDGNKHLSSIRLK